MKNQHVVPRKKGWAVKSENSKRATKIYDIKTDAIDHAEKISGNKKSCLVIHDRKGKFQEIDCKLDKKNQHVIPYKDKWAVVRVKRKDAKIFTNKGAAMSHAHDMAVKSEACMIIHDGKGKFKTFLCEPDKKNPNFWTQLRMGTKI